MKMKRKKLSLAVVQALGVGLVVGVAAPSVHAQADVSTQTFRLDVTGTRIKSLPGLTSFSPISSVSAEEVNFQQPATVEEFFKTLPSAQASVGSNTNNGSGGGATIDLRGLGANRNLVLIDGRRVVPFDLFGAVNTDVIPLSLLQRVDLITGGATAVYGADAISGVANFILKKDFRGFDVTTTYGRSNYGDGTRTRTDFTFGAPVADGRGNVAFSFGVTKTQPIFQGERPWSVAAISSTSGKPQGSATTVPTFEGDILGQQIDPKTGTFVDALQTFNFNPYNYFQTPLDRNQGIALGNYLINNNAEVYGNFMFTRSDVSSHIAPTGGFFNDFQMPLGNPFLPAAARQQLCDGAGLTAAQCADNNYEVTIGLGRRFVELGPRLNDFQNTMYQWTIGLRGDIAAGWTYDGYYMEGKSQQNQTRGSWGSLSKVQAALRSVDPATCIDPSNGCVPLNIWGAAGSITPAMLGFINLDAVLGQTVFQKVLSVSAEGDFGKSFTSPWSKVPITAAFGYDQRTVNASNKSDGPSQTQGEVLGTGAPTPDRSGQYTIREGYAEMQLPIVTDMMWARKLTLDAGYRYTTFQTTSTDTYSTYKVGLNWEPVQGLLFRSAQNRATRAPNINELYAPLITGLDNLAVDPCQLALINQAQANTPGTLSNLCLKTGVPFAKIGSLQVPSAGQINSLTGGNPNLGPEVSDTFTVGFVWTPTKAKGVTASFDYYNIKIVDAISQPASPDVLNGCYTTALNPGLTFNNFCALIGRNPNNGTFNGVASKGVVLATSNQGYIRTAGYDLFLDYATLFSDLGVDPKYGRLDMNFIATYVDTYEFRLTPSSVLRNCVGYYSVGCNAVQSNGGPIFRTKFTQRSTWTMGDWLATYNWRYLSSVQVEPDTGTIYKPSYSSIPAYNYIDVAVQWSPMKNVQLNLSINNLFDKGPPSVGNTIGGTADNSGNTFPQSYDVVGRFATLGLSLKF